MKEHYHNKHLSGHRLHDRFQSAYRQYHSTETALLRVVDDLRRGVDDGNVGLLVLLDLSAAFNTIDHERLLHRLQYECGICGTALFWFQSYLQNRSQRVSIKNITAEPTVLKYGVPQGSVLGPQLFNLYTKPLGPIIENHDFLRHFNADESQQSL